MSKKRYTLYLSRPLARKFDLVAQQRQGAKSALVEEALRAQPGAAAHPGLDDALARRLDELNRNVARIGRDVAIATETLALFVRYFLTITPPLPQSEQEPARLLGRERFQVFVAQVGRRLGRRPPAGVGGAGEHRHQQPGSVRHRDRTTRPLRSRPGAQSSHADPRPNGQQPKPRAGDGHG